MQFFEKNLFANPALNKNSLINVYLDYFARAKEERPPNVLFGPDLLKKSGTWLSEANRERDPIQNLQHLYLDIGCHFGKSICEMGADHPNNLFVGFDLTLKRVIKTAKKAQRENLSNVYSSLFDGRFLNRIFAPNEVDGIFVLFPDPWNRQKKQKHRLLQKPIMEMMMGILKPGGFLFLKTDCESYFRECEAIAADLRLKESASNSDSFIFEHYKSSFQLLQEKEGKTIFKALWTKS